MGFLLTKPGIYGIAVVVLLGVLGGTYLKGRTAGEARGEAIAQAALRERDTAILALRASQAASEEYASELEAIRNRPVSRRVVRLCSAADVPVPGTSEGDPGGAGGAGGVPAPDGSDPRPGPDIGPDLMKLAQDADQCSAQLRALQGWIKGVRQGSTQ